MLTPLGEAAAFGRRHAQLELRYQNSKNALDIAKSRLRLVREAQRAASRASAKVDLNVDLLLSQMFGTLDRIRLQMSRDLLYLELNWLARSGLYASWNLTYTGELYADNANETEVDASQVSNLRFGYNGFFDDWEIAPFLGINNLFDESYNNNIRINAFGERYFEPAPERNAYVGISIRARLGD